MSFMSADDMEMLEAMVDRNGLGKVLSMLETICCEKAQHVSANWQDEDLAQSWERDASMVGKVNVEN